MMSYDDVDATTLLECYQRAHNRTSIYFFQSTSVRCDVIVLLSIYDVIQSPQFLGIDVAHAQTVDTRSIFSAAWDRG